MRWEAQAEHATPLPARERGLPTAFPVASTVPGAAALHVACTRGRSTAVSFWARDPLKLLVPRPQGACVWAFLSSHGGGLVTGDRTRLELHLEPSARAFLGSQSTPKVYRRVGAAECSHHTSAVLESGALLVFAPDLLQAFAGAHYEQAQSFHLADDASLVLVDGLSSGRAARGERWAFDQLTLRTEIWQNGRRRIRDALSLNAEPGPLTGPSRLGSWNALATVWMLGPKVRALAEAWMATLADDPVSAPGALRVGGSPVHLGSVFRLAAREPEVLTAELRRRLSGLAPELGDDPWERKW